MPTEFVSPLRNRSRRTAGGSRSKKRAFKSISSAGRRRFLVAVAFWVLVLGSMQGILGSAGVQPRDSSRMGPLSLSISPSARPAASRSVSINKLTAQPAITPWRGPIQPLVIRPSDEAPVIFRIPTNEPVVFVGIDDGWVQTPEELDWLTRHHLPLTLFLTSDGIKNNYSFFKKLQSVGMTIQNHTVSHPHLPSLNFDRQKAEICGASDAYQSVFGRRPTLFRPPYGEYNDDTRRAAAACGVKALVLWHVVIGTGGDVQFQTGNNHLQPGDIVLMHFRHEFLADVQAFAQEVEHNHLQIGRLEDWIP